MGEGFIRFKRKYFLDALLKAVLTGVSVALLVVATFLLVIRLGNIDFRLLFGILIGIALGLLSGLVLFFVLHLNDLGVAKKLDKELMLREKVQTMYAFKDDNDTLKLLQREDAANLVDSASQNMSGLVKHLVPFILAAALSLAFCITSLAVYLNDDSDHTGNSPDGSSQSTNPSTDGGEDDDPFDATDHHRIALEALIKEVEKSNLQQDAKQAVIAELTILLTKLDELGTESEMKEYVIGVIKNVRGIVNTVNTTFAFHMYSRENGGELLQQLSTALYGLNLNLIETELEKIRETVFTSGSRENIAAFKDELKLLLDNSGIPEDDMLYTTTKALYDELARIVENDTYSDDFVSDLLDDAFTATFTRYRELIPQQRTNEDVKVMVVNELMRIFGITEADLEEHKNDNGDIETEEPEERPEHGDDGGFGTGESIFGSNDIVIDTEKVPGDDIDSINVAYGEVINRYDAKITELINSGKISEELADILNEYFSILLTPDDK